MAIKQLSDDPADVASREKLYAECRALLLRKCQGCGADFYARSVKAAQARCDKCERVMNQIKQDYLSGLPSVSPVINPSGRQGHSRGLDGRAALRRNGME